MLLITIVTCAAGFLVLGYIKSELRTLLHVSRAECNVLRLENDRIRRLYEARYSIENLVALIEAMTPVGLTTEEALQEMLHVVRRRTF